MIPGRLMSLALVCWTVGENDLAEKWMQRALQLEPDPQRHQLMECERLVYRKDYGAALARVTAVAAGSEDPLHHGRRSGPFLFDAGRRLAGRHSKSRSQTQIG